MSIASIGKAVHQIIRGRIARGESTGIELVRLSEIKGRAIIFDDLPEMDINIDFPKNKVVRADQYERELSEHCVMLYQADGAAVWWTPVQNCSIGADSDFQFSENLIDAKGNSVDTYVAVVQDIALTALDMRRPNAVKSEPDKVEQPEPALPWPF